MTPINMWDSDITKIAAIDRMKESNYSEDGGD